MATKKQLELIERINAAYAVGKKVRVRQDNGSILTWTIKAPASMLGGHTPVIWCEEHSSCYNAERVVFPLVIKENTPFKKIQECYPDAIKVDFTANKMFSDKDILKRIYGDDADKAMVLKNTSSVIMSAKNGTTASIRAVVSIEAKAGRDGK